MRTESFMVIFAGKMIIKAPVLAENSYKFQCYFDLENIFALKRSYVLIGPLEVSPEKTRILLFSRGMLKQSETFDFLGFEFRRALSRKFKPIIRRRTSRKKLRASMAAFTEWIKTNRNKKISKLMTTLRAKYRGYWSY